MVMFKRLKKKKKKYIYIFKVLINIKVLHTEHRARTAGSELQWLSLSHPEWSRSKGELEKTQKERETVKNIPCF